MKMCASYLARACKMWTCFLLPFSFCWLDADNNHENLEDDGNTKLEKLPADQELPCSDK